MYLLMNDAIPWQLWNVQINCHIMFSVGMTDIARQTVEFLYEENGGIPRDLHLPTIENIKEDLAKFTIEKVKKGTTVVVRNTTETSTAGTTVLPKFAVRSMLKTFGLTGNVLDVDNVRVKTLLLTVMDHLTLLLDFSFIFVWNSFFSFCIY